MNQVLMTEFERGTSMNQAVGVGQDSIPGYISHHHGGSGEIMETL